MVTRTGIDLVFGNILTLVFRQAGLPANSFIKTFICVHPFHSIAS